MLTMTFERTDKAPLYEQLYHRVRLGIEAGELKDGEKLPSKRTLAGHLQVSVFTVESAYTQLLAEGYITAYQKKGYYVCAVPVQHVTRMQHERQKEELAGPVASAPHRFNLKTNAVDIEHFPYSIWSRLMRESMRKNPALLLNGVDPQGNEKLREEITKYLAAFRGVTAKPEQIILGAGIEYLIGLITELLPDAVFAFENPGYQKVGKILVSRKAAACPVSVDQSGLCVEELDNTNASAVFVTPSNQFPTGAVMGIGRRQRLIEWASQREDRYIIEDDFDSEFRFILKPIPALQSLDYGGKVIYINSFAKTLAPSMRIAYAVLPETLLKNYRSSLLFYACTVSQFEQLTLMQFLRDGYYERHLNRMRTVYKRLQNVLIEGLSPLKDTITVSGQKAGLHLLIFAARLTERELVQAAAQKGVGVYPLSAYYSSPPPETNTIVIGYAGYSDKELKTITELLCEAWR